MAQCRRSFPCRARVLIFGKHEYANTEIGDRAQPTNSLASS